MRKVAKLIATGILSGLYLAGCDNAEQPQSLPKQSEKAGSTAFKKDTALESITKVYEKWYERGESYGLAVQMASEIEYTLSDVEKFVNENYGWFKRDDGLILSALINKVIKENDTVKLRFGDRMVDLVGYRLERGKLIVDRLGGWAGKEMTGGRIEAESAESFGKVLGGEVYVNGKLAARFTEDDETKTKRTIELCSRFYAKIKEVRPNLESEHGEFVPYLTVEDRVHFGTFEKFCQEFPKGNEDFRDIEMLVAYFKTKASQKELQGMKFTDTDGDGLEEVVDAWGRTLACIKDSYANMEKRMPKMVAWLIGGSSNSSLERYFLISKGPDGIADNDDDVIFSRYR